MSRLAVLACLAAFTFTCLLAATLGLPADAEAHRAGGDPSRALVHHINDYRAAHGLRRLRVSRSLSRSARRYSKAQMRADYFGHASSIQASGRWRTLGEVLALKRGWGRAGPLGGWRRSPTHASVLLNRGFRAIGVGRVSGRFGGRLATIWTVQVGRR